MSSHDSDWASFLQAALLTVLEASDEGLIVFDAQGWCRMIGRRAGEMFGIAPSEHVGRPGLEVIEAFAKVCEDPSAFRAAAASPLGTPTSAAEVDVRLPLPRTVSCRAIAIPRDGRTPGRVVFLRDVTLERTAESSTRQLRARLRALTPFDSLTGLLNQRRLFEELEREHSRSVRAWDSYGLLLLDVDLLRAINDEYGVSAGDEVLEQIARRLETCVREYDVLARLDGDQFAALLPGADAVAVRAVGERMIQSVGAQPFSLATRRSAAAWTDGKEGQLRFAVGQLGTERAVTVSIGGALWNPPSSEKASDILSRAGEALRHAASQGGAQICLESATERRPSSRSAAAT